MTRLPRRACGNVNWMLQFRADGLCGAAVAAFLVAAPFQSGSAQEAEPTARYEAVVPPGQDELLSVMLGRGAMLPDDCRFNGGGADGPLIQAKYACPGAEVAFELVHPSVATDEATETEQFALTLTSGNAPEGLADALTWLIRSKESTFEWAWNAVDEEPDPDAGELDDEPAIP